MYRIIICLLSLLFTQPIPARLIDKILLVIDDKIYTSSDLEKIKENYISRHKISPLLYKKNIPNDRKLLEHLIKNNLIKHKLKEMGIIISEKMISAIVKEKREQAGANEKNFIIYLNQNNLTLKNYKNILKESREFILFIEKFIRPSISISEHQLQNIFYTQNPSNKTHSFIYDLINFSIPERELKTSRDKENFKKYLVALQRGDTLPDTFKNISGNKMGQVSEEQLNEQFKKVIDAAKEKKFTDLSLLGNTYHVFYVKKKTLKLSSFYKKSKVKIHDTLFQEQVKTVLDVWVKREKNKHYIKTFI